MKYEMYRDNNAPTFKPFKIVLTIETKEDYIKFHDNVMVHITGVDRHQFHAEVFQMGSGRVNEAKGAI